MKKFKDVISDYKFVLERLKKIVMFFDKLSYFLPDAFLVAFILSVVKGYDIAVSVSLLIAYLGTCYGEYMYHRVITAREILLNDVLPEVKKMEQAQQHFVTKELYLEFAKLFEKELNNLSEDTVKRIKVVIDYYDQQLEEIEDELERCVKIIEVDKEKTS